MKWTAALFFLPFLQTQADAPRFADPVDPPMRVDLRVGDHTVRVDLGVTRPARDGLPDLRADLCPTREFVAPGAFAFEFPRDWRFSGGANGLQGWWSVTAGGAMVHMQRHADDPIATRDLYVKNALAGFGDASAAERTLVLGGRELAARSVEFTQGSLRGGPPERTRQDVVGFRAGGASWVLVFGRPLAPSNALPSIDSRSFSVPPSLVGAPAPANAAAELDALVASFRWL